MAKRDLSRTQRGIVNRYYENRDSIMVQKLGEIVSELAIADDQKKAARLWKRAETALANTDLKPDEVQKLVNDRDLQGLAGVVQRLS